VGHEGTGSYSLHTDKTGLFRSGIQSIADSIADVFNRYAIPRLFEVNGWRVDALPQIIAGDIDPPDLTQLSQFMGQLTSAGIQWFPDPELEKFLRDAARLPKLDETNEAVKETEARQAAIMRLAQQRVEMMTMAQQVEQAPIQTEQAQLGLDQTKQSMAQADAQQAASEAQGDPRVAEQQGIQQVASGDMDLEAKAQQMSHAEDMHQAKLEQMKTQAASAVKGEDPRFADQKLKQGDDLHKEKVGQMKFQTKAQQELHSEKIKSMKLKPKAASTASKTPPKAKEKK
jgi:hypothetical protein